MPQVGAADAITKGEQHFGNSAHADAADAYEMNALNLGKHKESIVKEERHRRSTGLTNVSYRQ